MKFDKTLKEMYKVVLEQAPPADPSSMTAGPGPIVPGAQTNQPADATDPSAVEGENDETGLTSEGEVMLIRLIAKALVVKPSTEDMVEAVGLTREKINPANAQEVLEKLISLIRKYSDEGGI